MIKFAVTRPTERRQGIEAGVEKIDWANDYYLKRYGLKIQPTMLQTQARLLAPPVVQFKEKSVSPGTTGRWRIDGQKFLKPNLKPLVSWGVCIFNSMG
jgi:eukaryotic translation initiation factor 2C